jgi:hypothetical protein
MRIAVAALACLALAALSGCAPPETIGDYFLYRQQDLIDIAHVDVSLFSYGASVFMAPLIAGCSVETDWSGDGPANAFQLGIGGWRLIERRGVVAGTIIPPLYPLFAWSRGRPDMKDLKVHDTTHAPEPAPGTLGAHVGLFLGITVQVGGGELIDFLCGLFCLDPFGDDFYFVRNQNNEWSALWRDARLDVFCVLREPGAL